MAWNLAQLERHLAEGPMKPAYLVAGEEPLLVMEAADAIRARARTQGYLEREVLEAETGFDWDAFAMSCASLSLFSSRRLIDLRLPSGKPGTQGAEAIQGFLRAPPPDTILLVTAATWSKAHEVEWVRALEQVGAFFPAWPLKEEQRHTWILHRAAKSGLRLQPDAAQALMERTEGNLLAAAQELDKLALLAGDHPIDAETLAAWVSDHARFDVFRMLDAALSGDAARALRISRSLQAEGEQLPALIGWISHQLQLLVRMAQQVRSGKSIDQVLRGTPGVWQNRFSVYRAALGRGGAAFWEACLCKLAHLERLSKGRAQGAPWQELERLLASVAQPAFAAHARKEWLAS